ncbi:hemerythrin domain-containing protein [Kitasatospora sp. NPDC015120]|uniref:hemerythrin domain-containing protein n=1 Tax=Kitasatospora sp. NPDC015120 TaxID=3364023 RepID=UPI0036F46E14
MNGPDGLLADLSTAHRAVEALLRRLDTVHARGEHAVADGHRLLAELDRLLDEHLTAEETYFYPLVGQYLPAGRALADAAAHTHTTVRRLLARAMDERLPAADRTHCTGALLVLLRAHLSGENERLFPLVRAAVPAAELRRCADRLAEARRTGPCSSVWGLPPGTGAIASLRERFTGHDSAHRPHSP